MQQLMDRFYAISLKKMQVRGQDVDEPPTTSIANHELEAVHEFVYRGSTISDNLS